MVTEGAYLVLLALLAGERGFEVWLSRRNAARVRRRGAVERGAGHFKWMVALHAAFLPCCAAEVLLLQRPFVPALAGPMLAVAALAQALRYAAVRALGDRWNVRVLVVPGEPPVTRGPYRFVRHPNYVAVVLEGIAVPLVHSAFFTAAAFSVLNAALLLFVRVPAEERALAEAAAS